MHVIGMSVSDLVAVATAMCLDCSGGCGTWPIIVRLHTGDRSGQAAAIFLERRISIRLCPSSVQFLSPQISLRCAPDTIPAHREEQGNHDGLEVKPVYGDAVEIRGVPHCGERR